MILQPRSSILNYFIATFELLPAFGRVLATLGHVLAILEPFLKSYAMWSLASASLTRPGGMREAIDPPPPVADRVAGACWTTFDFCRLLFFEDFVFHGLRTFRQAGPWTPGFTP